jgi:2-polyprenyl-6-methoxyphenol hydroxylase-like FAD-dependent oxidoreductase
MRPLDVGIIGCGTAGSAAALFLASAGHRVTVYERVPSPRPVGAGITIQPTGLHVLARLGLRDHAVARGAPIDRLVCETKSRRRIFELSYETARPGLFGLGTHRGVLFEALFGAVQRTPGVSVVTGVEIVDLARAQSPAAARWSWFVDSTRNRHGPHELVVVADGARSQLRDDTHTSKRIERYPWGALWFVGPDSRPRPRSTAQARTLHQVVDGNHTFVGMLPTGLGPGDGRTPLVSLFWSLRADRVDEWRRRGLAAWKAEVTALAPEVEPILDQIHDADQLLFAMYHDVVMHRWHTRNVVYLGDAAHATSPQLGQGANLALWDAMELADCLAAEPRDLAFALGRYSRRREGHLSFYQNVTRWLTPFFQGDVALLGHLRDMAMPILATLPPFRKLMTLSMLGVVDGWLGGQLALELPNVRNDVTDDDG